MWRVTTMSISIVTSSLMETQSGHEVTSNSASLYCVCHCKYAGLILPRQAGVPWNYSLRTFLSLCWAVQRIVLCSTRLNGDGTDSIVSVGGCILPPDKINRAKHWDMAGVLLHSNIFSCVCFLSCLLSFACFLFYFGIKLFHDMNCEPGPQNQ